MKFIRAFDAAHRATTRLDPAEARVLSTLEQDWRTISARPDMVTRFDPALLDAALPYAFMLERTAPGALRTRVAGQRLHDILKMDPRGMPFTSFFTERSRDLALRMAEQAFLAPAVVGIPLSASRSLGRKPLRGEALLLPLRDAQGRLTRVMGALVVSGPIGRGGLRFDVAADQPMRCDVMTTDYPDRRAPRGPMARPETTRAAAISGNGPQLRLVVNNG